MLGVVATIPAHVCASCLFVYLTECVMCLADVVSTSPILLSCVALQPCSCMGYVGMSLIKQQ